VGRGLTSALAELTDALLAVPAIADPSSRRALVSPFRSRIADAITEHPRARAYGPTGWPSCGRA
jgi:hypothetical protein